jgi:hypothetical protein
MLAREEESTDYTDSTDFQSNNPQIGQIRQISERVDEFL